MDTPVQTWSFSAVKNFEACPYYTYLERVEKAEKPDYSDDPKHPLVRGDRVHKEAELYVQGEGPFTKDLKKFPDSFWALREAYDEGRVHVEEKWGFDRNWAIVEWAERWAGVICDAVVLDIDDETGLVKSIRIIDYKTGKSFGKEISHQQQLQLYAVATFMRFPDTDIVTGEMWYLDEGKTLVRRFNRAQMPHFLKRWHDRGHKLTTAMSFPPKPSLRTCKYCAFGPQNGTGVCPYAPDGL
jgi:RecB family exonuclease